MTIKEAASQLGVSESKVYRLCESRQLSHYRIGDRYSVTPAQLEAFRESCLVEAAPAKTNFKWIKTAGKA